MKELPLKRKMGKCTKAEDLALKHMEKCFISKKKCNLKVSFAGIQKVGKPFEALNKMSILIHCR